MIYVLTIVARKEIEKKKIVLSPKKFQKKKHERRRNEEMNKKKSHIKKRCFEKVKGACFLKQVDDFFLHV
jgi:hypothetical protein